MASLVLLPGLLCDQDLWSAQIKHLSKTFEQIVCVDYPPLDSMQAIAEEIFQSLDKQGIDDFALAGLSMGGIVAFEMFRQKPERMTHLALFDTNHEADTEEKSAMRRKLVLMADSGNFEKVIVEYLKPAMIFPDNFEAIKDRVLRMGMRIGKTCFRTHQQALIDRADSTETLKSIDCPVAVICGREDKMCTPQIHQQMQSLIPDAIYREIPDCGHLSTMEQPKAVNSILTHFFR